MKNIKLLRNSRTLYKAIFDDLNLLNIETPEIICKATEHIKEMIEYVEKLIENGYAYETSTAIYLIYQN